ncbi:VOC family protein [Variovorax paradoxus]|uniref:VOC family protein n=1 Tax=Variovorax paradoxus TaxID=34073 RepID=A0A6I6HLL2_VARPD|nr:VOC family protein [Variovorax paradoxus]QGW83821.1 VOC family protein [Variovorax paradoxus]
MQAYLTFNGNAAEALAFYAKALGGKIIFSMTFGESPMGAETPDAYKGKIMHATLEARGHQLMASDMPPGMAFEGYKGFSLSVQGNNVDEGKKLFEALAEGGEVTMPYGPQFWAVGFGMLTDKFGVPWMVNCEK